METQYDVVVVGAGSGGLTAAVGFAKVGKRVLLIEREHMGGECTNTGCIPSKALLHHAKQYYLAQNIAGKTTKTTAYRNTAFEYVQSVIKDILADETPDVFKKMGIDVVLGEAVFLTKCSVKVAEATYTYKHAVIASGSSPRPLDIPGLDAKSVLTNQNVFDLTEIPKRLLIIGSGPIGMEMGHAFAMLGSHVSLASIDSQFARLEDETIGNILKQKCTDLGIDIHLNAFIKEINGNKAFFEIKKDETVVETISITFDKILIAVGRIPNIPAGLEAAGIQHTSRGIAVDTQYRTSNKYVYAVGDVAQALKFTHTADDTARQVVARVASRGWLRVNQHKAVPKVTYTVPEVAQVGLSFTGACTKYNDKEVMRIEVPYSENDRAKTDSATNNGLLVVTVRRINGAILGANIIGPAAGELISIFTLAIDRKVSMWRLQKLIFPYPTYSLVIKKAADQFFARQLGDLKVDLLHLGKKHAPKFIVGVLWAVGLWQLYNYQESHGMDATMTALMVFDFVSMTAWGPLVFIGFYMIRPLTFFPATALTILAGVFFGLWTGILLTIIAANLSALVAYVVGRFFGSNLRLEDSFIGNWVVALRKNAFTALLTMRLIFLPFDGVSYLSGVLRAPVLAFVGATFLGTILGTATFVAIGASLDIEEFKMDGISFNALEPQFLALSAIIFVVSLGISRLLKRWKQAS